MRKRIAKSFVLIALTAATALSARAAAAQSDKPNILVIMTDDVGIWNISAYHRGMMGGRTPNIDRIANEGALFTDYYAQQSCTIVHRGPCGLHPRSMSLPHRSAEGRSADCQTGRTGQGPYDRPTAEALGLRDRTDW